MGKEPSRRQRLLRLAGSGDLRYALEGRVHDTEVVDLIVDICLRYAEPRRKRQP
jgi:hypothetical protein